MFKKIHKHLWYYIMLVMVLMAGVIVFFSVGNDRMRKLAVGVLVSLTYAAWGILHHWYEKDLNWKIVVEYSGFALLAISMLWVFLFI